MKRKDRSPGDAALHVVIVIGLAGLWIFSQRGGGFLMHAIINFLGEIARFIGDAVNAMFASLLTAALAGRLAWHTRLVQKGERRFWSKEMGYEAIVVVFLFYVSQSAVVGLSVFLGVSEASASGLAPGLAAIISYFGPGGVQAGIVAVWEKFGAPRG